jgi:hypothetical protein
MTKHGNPGALPSAGARKHSTGHRPALYTPRRPVALVALRRSLARATEPELRERLALAIASLERGAA